MSERGKWVSEETCWRIRVRSTYTSNRDGRLQLRQRVNSLVNLVHLRADGKLLALDSDFDLSSLLFIFSFRSLGTFIIFFLSYDLWFFLARVALFLAPYFFTHLSRRDFFNLDFLLYTQYRTRYVSSKCGRWFDCKLKCRYPLLKFFCFLLPHKVSSVFMNFFFITSLSKIRSSMPVYLYGTKTLFITVKNYIKYSPMLNWRTIGATIGRNYWNK